MAAGQDGGDSPPEDVQASAVEAATTSDTAPADDMAPEAASDQAGGTEETTAESGEPSLSGPAAKQKAMELLGQSQPDQAATVLLKNAAGNEDDVEYRFLTGMALMESGQPGEAIPQFEAAAELSPDSPRIRLELARACNQAGKRVSAHRHFERVLDMEPPAAVRGNVEWYLSQIPGLKNWGLYLSAGGMYDSNVSAGPDIDTVSIFGIPYDLAPDSQEQGDYAYMTNAVLEYGIPMDDEWSIRTSFNMATVAYQKYSEFNLEQFGLLTGPRYEADRWLIGIPFAMDYTRLGSEQYGLSLGVAPEVRYAVNDRLAATLSTEVQSTKYWLRSERTGNRWALNPSLMYLLDQHSFVDVGFSYLRENTEVSYLDNDRASIYAGYYTQLPWEIDLYIRPTIAWTTYDEAEAAFPAARDDTQYMVNVNLSTELWDSGFDLVCGYTFTKNDSNLPLYEYDRHQLTLQISRDF
jgi:tetratricopeptide (TPR) repeat protein